MLVQLPRRTARVVPGFAFLASIIAIFSGAQLFALGHHRRVPSADALPRRWTGRPTWSGRSPTTNEPPTCSTRFEGAGAILECSLVPWDTEIFGFPVAQIDRHRARTRTRTPTDVLERFDAWCAEHDGAPRLVPARPRAAARIDGPRGASGSGSWRWSTARASIAFDAIGAPRHDIRRRRGDGRGSRRDRGDRVLRAFTTGRFLLDQRLAPELSNRRYATWVRTSFESARQTVLKAEVDGELVGFFIVERRPDASVYWHLTAIAPESQGKGIGMSLWQTDAAAPPGGGRDRPSRRRSPATTCRSSTCTRDWASRSRRPR